MLTIQVQTFGLWAMKVRFLEILRRGIDEAVNKAADVAIRHARANHIHQRRTGYLTSPASLKWRKLDRTVMGASFEFINDAPYARFVEYETKHFYQIPRVVGGKVLRFVGRDGRVHFRRSVTHPGTPAMPFMQPAAEKSAVAMHRHIETIVIQRLGRLFD